MVNIRVADCIHRSHDREPSHMVLLCIWHMIRPVVTSMIREGVPIAPDPMKDAAPGTLDAEEFARMVRRLAAETHRVLNRPETKDHELVELRQQFRHLLHESRGWRLAEIDRWLRSANHKLEAKLLSGLRGDAGSR